MKLQKRKNQGVQCTIQDNLSNINTNEKQSELPKSVSSTKKEDNWESSTGHDVKSKFYNSFVLCLNKNIQYKLYFNR